MVKNMICERCNHNEASIHFTEVINGARTEHHLCSECAKKMELGYGGEFSFAKLLTGLFASARQASGDATSPMAHVVCPECGMNFEEFTQVGKFGCAECYGVFGPLIDDNMKKIHGSNTHMGKVYKNDDINEGLINKAEVPKISIADEEKLLRAKLKEAIELEEYEDAAKIRDQIKALNNEPGGVKND